LQDRAIIRENCVTSKTLNLLQSNRGKEYIETPRRNVDPEVAVWKDAVLRAGCVGEGRRR
jgi:hypothetical protein